MTLLTDSQKSALRWLHQRGGDAGFDKNGIALAQGETAPVMRSTWNKLQERGLVLIYGGVRNGGSGYGRVKLTDVGTEAVSKPKTEKGIAYYGEGRGSKHQRPLMQDDDPEEFFA